MSNKTTVKDLCPGRTLTLKDWGHHGDWKTAAVFPDRWPAIPPGTQVEFVKSFVNFEGQHLTVKWDNQHYDIKPECFVDIRT